MSTYNWKIYKVPDSQWEYWYDKHCKCWMACTRDAEGNQIDAAIDAYTKREIINAINKEINR